MGVGEAVVGIITDATGDLGGEGSRVRVDGDRLQGTVRGDLRLDWGPDGEWETSVGMADRHGTRRRIRGYVQKRRGCGGFTGSCSHNHSGKKLGKRGREGCQYWEEVIRNCPPYPGFYWRQLEHQALRLNLGGMRRFVSKLLL